MIVDNTQLTNRPIITNNQGMYNQNPNYYNGQQNINNRYNQQAYNGGYNQNGYNQNNMNYQQGKYSII